LTVESTAGNQVILYRKGTKGRYRGQLSSDGKRIENGTADWFKDTWTASIQQ
jgi:hypothetical protein